MQRGVHDAFVTAFAAASERLRVGDPALDTTDIGPLVDAQGLTKVQEHMRDALAKGASVVTGGSAIEGLYFRPTVVTGSRRTCS